MNHLRNENLMTMKWECTGEKGKIKFSTKCKERKQHRAGFFASVWLFNRSIVIRKSRSIRFRVDSFSTGPSREKRINEVLIKTADYITNVYQIKVFLCRWHQFNLVNKPRKLLMICKGMPPISPNNLYWKLYTLSVCTKDERLRICEFRTSHCDSWPLLSNFIEWTYSTKHQ